MIEKIIERMMEWNRLGEKTNDSGSKVIAHTPRDYPDAFLHAIYAPKSTIKWKEYEMELPGQLEELYKECNGLNIFAGSLTIYGIRDNFTRDISSAQFQPFDLKTHDKEHREIFHKLRKGDTDERTFFGSYEWDGSGVFIIKGSEKVYRCLREECTPINEWMSLKKFLEEEYKRIEKHFDENGYLINENIPTTPEE